MNKAGDKSMREQSLLVSCPHCKTKYHIPPELLGQKTECPRCAKQFTMELAEKEQPERPGKASLPPRMTVPEPPPSRPSLVIVSCHSCGVKYEIPAEFLGDSAECSECGDIFTLTEDPENLSDNTEVIAAKAELDENENLVKFYRKKVGMLPKVKDHFSVAVVATHSSMNIPKEIIPPPPPKRKWWQFWK